MLDWFILSTQTDSVLSGLANKNIPLKMVWYEDWIENECKKQPVSKERLLKIFRKPGEQGWEKMHATKRICKQRRM